MENILDFLTNLDTSVFLTLNGARAPFFDTLMYMYSGRFIWIPMYAAVLFLLYRNYNWRTATIYLLAIALTIAIADQACATWIRPFVARLRPSNLQNPLSALTQIVNDYRGRSYGFPSCHASNSLAFATFAALMVKRRSFTLFIMAWAIVNCYSRIYLGVHYPGDLLVGAAIGAAAGWVVYSCVRYAANLVASPAGSFPIRHLTIAGRVVSFRDTSVVMWVWLLTVIYMATVSLWRLWV